MNVSSEAPGPRWRITTLVVAPAALAVALAAHPFIEGRLPNDDAIAREVLAGGTMRWGAVHLAASLASALIALAFLAVRHYLHEAGEDRRSGFGIPLVIVGSTLYAVLPGMEFAALAAADAGGTAVDVAAAQNAIGQWFLPVLIAGSLTFGVGAVSFARAISASRIAGSAVTRVIVAALIVMALARVVPLSAAQFYVHGLAALVAFWTLAYVMRTNPVPSTSRATTSATVG